MTLTPSQMDLRATGITATDVAALVGLHPHRSALDVWLAKRGQPALVDVGHRARWGNILEPVIRDDYAERHGVRVEVPGTMRHRAPGCERHLATPDGLVYPWGSSTPTHGLEIKTHTRWLQDEYGAPGTDDVPLHELIQCQWSMHVVQLPWWDLVPFIDGLPQEYRIPADHGIQEALADAADVFWQVNVELGVQPSPDGSESYRRYLLAQHERTRGCYLDATARTDEMVGELREARARFQCAERAEARARQCIMEAIGDHDGLGSAHGRITWRFNATGSRVFRVPRAWGKDMDE